MKRILWLILTICLFTIFIQPSKINAKEETARTLQSDLLITLLNPAISEAIEAYYGYHKSYGLYDIKILDITRQKESAYSFRVKVQVNTFEEAHNPPYGKETVVLLVETDKVKVIKFDHQGDAYERKIAKFYDETLLDIQNTFKLNLAAFEKLTYDQLFYKAEKEKQYKSLTDLLTDIVEIEINPEINTPYSPYKNVITPVTFINENEGYILFKKADGTNVVFKVSKSDGKWSVVNKKSKQGKKMKNDLLWYM